jgi:hypothetical protein
MTSPGSRLSLVLSSQNHQCRFGFQIELITVWKYKSIWAKFPILFHIACHKPSKFWRIRTQFSEKQYWSVFLMLKERLISGTMILKSEKVVPNRHTIADLLLAYDSKGRQSAGRSFLTFLHNAWPKTNKNDISRKKNGQVFSYHFLVKR